MVPSWSLALLSMCGTIPVVIGCHRLVRSTEATFLHMLHLPDTQMVRSSSPSGHHASWLCVSLLMCPSGGPLHVCLLHEPHLALWSCRSSRILEVVHLSWQAICEGHCHRVVADQPSDGLGVVTGYMHMCGAALVALGRHHSLRSMVVTSPCAPCSPRIITAVPSVTS